MNKIGIMHGRLSSPEDGKFQAFPWNSWQEEFRLAKKLGLISIEFIFDDKDLYKDNPLFSEKGILQIRKIIDETGIKVNHICADYFMECPFFNITEDIKEKRIEILKKLIMQCSKIGAKGIEVPFVDNSEMKTDKDIKEVISVLKGMVPTLEKNNIAIGLETSLPPVKFKKMLEEIKHPLIGANYDSGNSASLGYLPKEEIEAYGKFISNIHIKDRVFKEGTVALGTGDTDFNSFFQAISKIGYRGDFILQAARGRDGEEMEISKNQAEFVQNLIDKYLNK